MFCSKFLEQTELGGIVAGVETAPSPADDTAASLSEFQKQVIDLFVHAAQALSLPKSVGEIYGLLFATDEPLTLDGIVARLTISKGSASQGLRFLQNLMAVEKVYVPGDRRDHFVAEFRLRRLVTGFIRERAEPHLENGADRLSRLEQAAREADEPFAEERVRRLRSWHKRAGHLLPVIRRVLAVS